MAIYEIKMEETVICHNCRKIFMVKDWKPTDTLKARCPECEKRTLYWAIRTREERINKEDEENGTRR